MIRYYYFKHDMRPEATAVYCMDSEAEKPILVVTHFLDGEAIGAARFEANFEDCDAVMRFLVSATHATISFTFLYGAKIKDQDQTHQAILVAASRNIGEDVLELILSPEDDWGS